MLRGKRNGLNNRKQREVIHGKSARGSFLGYNRFLVYIDDIYEGITSKILRFADATKLTHTIVSNEQVKQYKTIYTICQSVANLIDEF